MVLNYIWIGFFLVAFATGLTKLILWGDTAVFPAMVEALFDMAKVGAEISLGYIGLMALWLGIMRIGELGGAVAALTRVVEPFFSRLFPEIPRGHAAKGSIMMNFSANMLGLDNAATPLGLKAMKELQELNPEKDRASNAQIMFLVLNTSGLTVIPISVITLRSINGAANPTDIFIPILIATAFASLVGLIAVSLAQKINLFQPVVLAWLGGILAVIGGLILYFQNPVFHQQKDLIITVADIHDRESFVTSVSTGEWESPTYLSPVWMAASEEARNMAHEATGELSDEQLGTLLEGINAIFENPGSDEISVPFDSPRELRERIDNLFPDALTSLRSKLISQQSQLLAAIFIFGIIIGFLLLAMGRKVNIYDAFIEGAKDGFGIAVKIIPYLVAMLVAIGVFRASGAMDLAIQSIARGVGFLGFNTNFVDALPTAAMKPLSGSGARGMAVEAMQSFGVDSFVGRLACTFQGSTETTFYTLAVYFGAVNVRRTRYTVTCGLIADAAGILAAIVVAYMFFGG